ncbi:MAG: MarR family transcriptional regulator [Thermomicrobiales bacterium]
MHDDGPHNQPTWIRTTPSWLLAQAAQIAQRAVNDALASEGVRRYHVAVLSALREFGPSSQAAIGRRCGIDRSDIAAVMGDLQGWALIERRRDPKERRQNIVTLTPAGQERLAHLDQIVGSAQDAILEGLSTTERDDLVRLLTSVVTHHMKAEPDQRQE